MNRIRNEQQASALCLLRTLLVRFDHGGESERSVRALLLSSAFRLLRKCYLQQLPEPIDVQEYRDFLGSLKVVALEEQLILDTDIRLLSNERLACFLLSRQHSYMRKEHDGLRYDLSVGIQKILNIRSFTSILDKDEWSKYTDEQLLREANNRLLSKEPAFL